MSFDGSNVVPVASFKAFSMNSASSLDKGFKFLQVVESKVNHGV
jgi:hypothetical protein